MRGPPIYPCLQTSADELRTIYASSGMSALTVLFLVIQSIRGGASILTFPGSYGETLELIDSCNPQLRRTTIDGNSFASAAKNVARILLIDSSVPRGCWRFEA